MESLLLKLRPADRADHPNGRSQYLSSLGRIERYSIRINAIFWQQDHAVAADQRIRAVRSSALAGVAIRARVEQARRNLRDPHAFHMSFADLLALNVFYMMPRPVYLISVVHEQSSNIFPMDLVGPLGGRPICARAAPDEPICRADAKQRTVRCRGRTGCNEAGDLSSSAPTTRKGRSTGTPSPFPSILHPALEFRRSPTRLEFASWRSCIMSPGVRTWSSSTSVANQTAARDEPQLCHVSDMYARWRGLQGRPFVDA